MRDESLPEPPHVPIPARVPILDGIAPAMDGIEGVILDLWGTVHDGYEPLPGALDAMAALGARGVRILIVSNAPRRAHAVVAKMDEVGVPRGLYDDVLSSGEATHTALARRDDPWHAALGNRVYLLGPPDDASVLEELDLHRVDRLLDADFIVAVGSFRRSDTVADYEGFLAEARTLGLPMVCANPDLVVLRGAAREICAGAIAARYEALGGEVFLHGKPHLPIYRRSMEMLGIGDPARVLAIGDSLHTDIAGARAAGLRSAFVTSGIYADRLGTVPFDAPSPERLSAVCEEDGIVPDFAVPAFRW